MTNNELKIIIPKGWIADEGTNSDGSRVLTFKLDTSSKYDLKEDIFKKVPASQLSLQDDFMNYIPKTRREKRLMELITKVIEKGVSDFWHPYCDPSFDSYGYICYIPGKQPAIGRCYNWWVMNAETYWPERGSRLGTRSEYIAFLAVLIKELVASGKTIEWSWNAVCNDSKDLGNYWDSDKYPKHRLAVTGNYSKNIYSWCDLSNTRKFLMTDTSAKSFWLAGGYYKDLGKTRPLANLCTLNDGDCAYQFSTGWLVLTKDS